MGRLSAKYISCFSVRRAPQNLKLKAVDIANAFIMFLLCFNLLNFVIFDYIATCFEWWFI